MPPLEWSSNTIRHGCITRRISCKKPDVGSRLIKGVFRLSPDPSPLSRGQEP